MKRMSEVLNIRVVKNAFYDASNDSWICAFVDEEKAQHAAHAINHVDALADALTELVKSSSGFAVVHSPEYKKAVETLAAFWDDK